MCIMVAPGKLRIIGGAHRGRRLLSPPTEYCRPTPDRAREALFSILQSRLAGAKVLDIFAGTGALGLEAWSRGAHELVLVDNSPTALKLLEANRALCLQDGQEQEPEIRIIRHNLTQGIGPLLAKDRLTGPFDLIFLDPPYGKGLAAAILAELAELAESSLLAPDGMIIAEEERGTQLPAALPGLELHDQRNYGTNAFWFYLRTEEES